MKKTVLTLLAITVLFNFTNAQVSYCTPASADCSLDMITNVTISTINNTTACSIAGYSTYTTPTTTLNQGTSYPIAVTVSAGYTECVSAWIDYNQDGAFDATEYTSIGCGDGVAINSSITIPVTATLGVTTMRVRVQYSSALTGADACLAYSWGETEDYLITIGTATVCTGTPTAGTASASADTVCSGINFDLVLTGYTSGVSGITFQWQSSPTPGGTYTNITGATTSTYATSQTDTTYYQCIVTCSGATSDTSNVVAVIMNNFMNCYCTSTSTDCTWDDVITNVTIATINNTTVCSTAGYSSYTTPTPILSLFQGYPIAVTVGSGGTEYVAAWIDYNQNGMFDTTEFISIGSGNGVTINSSITIPGTATLGNTMMRVRVRYYTALTAEDACLAYTYGETEDYLVTIATGIACTGTPTAGTASAPTGACSGVNFNLVLTGYTSGVSGITFQWQSSSTIGGTYTNITGATTSTYTTSQTDTTYYQCIVTCSGAASDTSNVVAVIMNTTINCYCATGSSDCSSYNDVITNVTIATINNTTGCSTAGYSSYSTPAPILNQGAIYPIAVTVGNGGTEYVAVWIDYNQNGVFDTTEFTSIGSGNGVTISSSITIPGSATSGNTMMRVRVRFFSALTAVDACSAYTSGETEDYLVTIASACTGTPTAGVASSSADTVCSGVNFDLVLTGYTSGISGITFQWQSSPTPGGTYTNITGATTSTYATSQTGTTYYQCIVTCSGAASDTSNVVAVIMNSVMNCYCGAINGGTSCITNVTLNALNRTSAGCENAPDYYTSVPAGTATTTVYKGLTYPLSVSIDNSYAAILSVWIDYDQNGIFEASEWNQVATNALVSTTSTINVLIPATAISGQTGMRIRSRNTGFQNGSTDACLQMGSGETEDYIITIGTAAVCTGTPTAGTATAPAAACSGVGFNLVLTGYTSGVSGLTFQWQSSSTLSGTYTNITGATTSTYTIAQTDTAYYQCIVTCSGGASDTSNVVVVMMNTVMNCYCIPTSTECTWNDVITNVTIATINNTTGCSTAGYSSYTTPTPTLNQSQGYPIAVTVGSGGTEYVAAWIDYNQNGVFDTTEFISIGSGNGVTINSTITIPGTATLGSTMMRVRVSYYSDLTNADACLGYTYGETEDYLVNIGAATACTGTPTAGVASASADTVCSGVNFNLVLTGYTSGISGITFQWQSSPTPGGTYTNITGATTSTYTITQTDTTYYQCIVTCSGAASDTSNVVAVIMNSVMNCYCGAINGGTSCITNVTLNALNRTSAGCENAPDYYTSVPAGTATTTVYKGLTYPLSVSIDNSYAAVLSVWIDYNQNGIFEASEWNQVATNALVSTTSTINVLIPATAISGQTGMRVRSRNTGSSNGSGDACTEMFSGETEDYVITIGIATICTGTPTAGVASASADTVCSGVNFNLVLTGYTSGVSGLTFQWQSSSTLSGTYTNITGATTSTYTIAQTDTTYYQCIVTCSGAASDTSNVVTVTMNAVMNCYCTPAPTDCSGYGDEITNVTIGTINNTTGCSTNGYSSYASPIPTLYANVSYPIAVTVGAGGTEYVAVWIDYNQNGVFDTTEFTSIGSGNGATINSTIVVPGTAALGNTMMRVRVEYYTALTNADACLAYFYGETEDYVVNITSLITGVNENTMRGLSIYPNPTSGLFNIITSNANFTELMISVFDIQGKEVFRVSDNLAQSGTNYNKQINLESLAKGIYYIKLNTDAGIKVQKLIIQ